MVSEIEAEAADRRERTGVPALGPAAILAPLTPLHLSGQTREWRPHRPLRATQHALVQSIVQQYEL
jgi:hypothetical protein